MGCGDIAGTLDPFAGLVTGTGPLFGSSPSAPGGDALLGEALANIGRVRAIAPEQLKVMNEFNPQFAASYGNTLASLYAGELPVYENQIAPSVARTQAAAQNYQRAGDLADFNQYGQGYTSAILGANPQQKALLDQLNASAMSGLAAGSSLRPEEARQIQQQSRAAFSARGLGGSNGAIGDELLRQFNLGQQLLQQRQGFGTQIAGLNQAVVGDPFLAITGRPSQVIGASNQLLGQSTGQYGQTGANNYNGLSDAYNTLFRDQDIKLAREAGNKQLIGQIVGGVLGSAGGAAAAI